MSSIDKFRTVVATAARWALVGALLTLSTGARADQSVPTPPDVFSEARSLIDRSVLVTPYGAGASISVHASAAQLLTAEPGNSRFQQAKLTATDSEADLIKGYALAASDTALIIGMSNRLGTRGKVVVLEQPDGDWSGDLAMSTLTPSQGHYTPFFGQALAITGDGATLVVGARGQAGSAGSVYVYERPDGGWLNRALTETTMLAPSDGAADDLFGQAVAIDGDTIVVGATGAENGAGAVYVHAKPDTGWADAYGTEAARLVAGDGLAGDGFGAAVSISGDDVLVAAPGADGTRGAAYVFQKPAGGWSDVMGIVPARLTASDGAAGDSLGTSADMDGTTVIIGAPGDDEAAGSAYVFEKSGTGWAGGTELAKLTASEAAPNDRFGNAVAISGPNVVIGSYGRGGTRTLGFVFTRPDAGWASMNQSATLLPRSTAGSRQFGRSVAIHGTTAVVGELNISRVYLYKEPAGGWSGEQAHLRDLSSYGGYTLGDEFGFSVSAGGDTALVGAYGHDHGVGAAYAYAAAVGGWSDMTETGRLVPNDPEVYDYGASMALEGTTAVVGADFAFVDNRYPGAAYVFEQPAAGWTGIFTESVKLYASDGADLDLLGYSVDMSGSTVVVGAFYHDIGEHSDQGAVYVFEEPAGGWVSSGGIMTKSAKLVASDGAPLDYFGWSVAVDGDTVVGSSRHAAAAGALYVYVKPESGWLGTLTETAKLTSSDGQPGDALGYPVAIDGNSIVAGAYGDDFGDVLGQGSAYVFERPSGGWSDATESAKLVASDGRQDDALGYGLAIRGNKIAVGATGVDIGNAADQGAVYVFERPTGGWAGIRVETTKVVAADGAASDDFGFSVSAFGDSLLVGAPEHGAGMGAAYIFDVPAPRQVWLPLAMQ